MPLTRDEKKDVVRRMADDLQRAEAVVMTDYRGLSVEQMTDLRGQLREKGSELRVIKNTLARRAFADAELDTPEEQLVGPTAVALLYDDLSGPTKVLLDFIKETDVLSIKGGLLEGRLLDEAAVRALADLPTRDELLTQLVGLLNAPARNVVTVLSAPTRNLVNVLSAYAREQEG